MNRFNIFYFNLAHQTLSKTPPKILSSPYYYPHITHPSKPFHSNSNNQSQSLLLLGLVGHRAQLEYLKQLLFTNLAVAVLIGSQSELLNIVISDPSFALKSVIHIVNEQLHFAVVECLAFILVVLIEKVLDVGDHVGVFGGHFL